MGGDVGGEERLGGVAGGVGWRESGCLRPRDGDGENSGFDGRDFARERFNTCLALGNEKPYLDAVEVRLRLSVWTVALFDGRMARAWSIVNNRVGQRSARR